MVGRGGDQWFLLLSRLKKRGFIYASLRKNNNPAIYLKTAGLGMIIYHTMAEKIAAPEAAAAFNPLFS
jgi:hypothetical protein